MTSSVDKVQETLEKIENVDRAGYELRAVLAISEDALNQAREYDATGKDLPLAGTPILIKDNIEAIGLPATAGSLALSDTPVISDSTIAKRLRAAGAIIIGSTNLSEWANIRSSKSTSGWSGVGGLTANPWVHAQSAGGSSSGSGAAVSAGLTQWAIGTETDGSIICPASLNGVVGVKPTVGLIPRDGVIPISSRQDTPGPMTQTVSQAAALISILSGDDSFHRAVDSSHQGSDIRVAVVKEWMTENPAVNDVFEQTIKTLSQNGFKIAEVSLAFPQEENSQDEYYGLLYDFAFELERYLANRSGARVRNLADVIEFNKVHSDSELQFFNQDLLEQALEYSANPADINLKVSRNLAWARSTLKTGLEGVDILLGCTYGPAWESSLGNGDNFADASWITMAPAIAGTPIGTIPMGIVNGLPVGLGFVSKANSDAQLLHAMFKAEGALDLGVLQPTFVK